MTPETKSMLKRVLLFVVLPLLLVSAVSFFSFRLLRSWLFTENPRLELREVKVRSTGYWREREAQLSRRIGLEKGVNIFSVDLRQKRRKLEKIPNVASAEVRRILPDKLEIRLEERIPRAAVGNLNSPYVIDDQCMVMPRLESLGASLRLPVVNGLPVTALTPGTREPRFQPAVDLLMTTLRGFPDIQIHQLSIARADRLDVTLTYRGRYPCRAFIPVKNPGYTFMLSALQSAIIAARRRGDTRNTFDLSYEGQVVLR